MNRFLSLLFLAVSVARAAGGVEIGLAVDCPQWGLPAGAPVLITATAMSDGSLSEEWHAGRTLSVSGPDGTAVAIAPVLRWSRVEQGVGRVLWTVDPAATREWGEGEYRVQLGEDATVVIRIKGVEAEDAGVQESLALLRVRWHKINGQREEAVRELDAWISAHEPSASALMLKADLLEETGDIEGALAALKNAITLKTADEMEPPVLLLQRHQRLLSRVW